MGQGKGYNAFSLTIDTTPLERLAKELKGFDREMGRAATLAVKDTLNRTKRKIPTIVVKEYAIDKEAIKNTGKTRVRAGKGYPHIPEASIVYTGHKLSLARFAQNPDVMGMSKAPTKQPQGIVVKVKHSTGSKALKRVNGRAAYVGPTGANMTAPFRIQAILFRRTGENKKMPTKGRYKGKGIKREPVEALRSTSIPQMVSNPKIHNQIKKYADETMDKRVTRHINLALDQIRKKVER